MFGLFLCSIVRWMCNAWWMLRLRSGGIGFYFMFVVRGILLFSLFAGMQFLFERVEQMVE